MPLPFEVWRWESWLAGLLLLGLTACAPNQPPPTATTAPPSPTAAAASPTATASPSPGPTATQAQLSSVPSATPTVTNTPAPPRRQDTLPTRPPTVTPTPGVTCSVPATSVNLREGPGTGYRVIANLPGGSTVQAQKTLPNDWLLVNAGQNLGWVYGPLLRCTAGLSSLPIAQGVPTPPVVAVAATAPAAATTTPVPATTAPPASPVPEIPVGRWRGEYYANASLLGEPALIREDEDINFNWILDSPAPEIPADNFSVRWTGQFFFQEAGDYRFFANVDDGVRVYVDGWLVIDAWNTVIPVDYEGRISDIEPGLHTVVVEYFESGGHARARVWGERTIFSDAAWRGEYYHNRTLEEPVLFLRDTDDINFDWGNDSPDYRLGSNNFSIRWTRAVYFNTGNYKFTVITADDDWVRLTIDGWTVLEKYQNDGGPVYGYFKDLGAGLHTLVLEFQEHGKEARVRLKWEQD